MTNNDYKSITKKAYNSVSKEYMERDKGVVDESLDIKIALDKFTDLVPSKAHILDIGSGGGRDSRFFYEHGFRVTGIDFSEKMIDGARAIQPNIDYRVMDLENMDFPNQEFDAIWANASLHHIPKANLPKVLNKINQILRGDGLFFIKVKHGDKDSILENDKFGRKIKRHFSFYKQDELRQLLESAGFSIKSSELTTKEEWVDIFAKKESIAEFI